MIVKSSESGSTISCLESTAIGQGFPRDPPELPSGQPWIILSSAGGQVFNPCGSLWN